MTTYEQFLVDLTDQIFDEAAKTMEWKELAKEAGLCLSTVYNLGTYTTKYPRLQTIYKLGRAVGMDVLLIQKRIARRAA